MKRKLLALVLACAGAGLVIFSLWPLKNTDRSVFKVSGTSMGTTWTVQWRGETLGADRMSAEVVAVLDHWERVMSHWREDSDLMRHERGEPVAADLQRAIDFAERLRVETGGAYDARIREAVGRAGFGPGGKGWDLSGMGKGWAVDRVVERLDELGVSEFVCELGGEVFARGSWPVGVEEPDPGSRLVGRVVSLKNEAMATSGNYRLFRPSSGGRLAAHIIDPRTGLPVERGPSSVSVVAADCATADGWATALFVDGPGRRDVPVGLRVSWQGKP